MVTQVLKHFLAAKWRWHRLKDKAALAQYQQQRMSAMLAFAQQHSRFYRQHWQGFDLEHIQRLPLTDKTLMMDNFDAFNTAGIKKEEALKVALEAEQAREVKTLDGYTVGLSSGTSGQRGLFVLSQQEQDMWTGVILARVLHSLKPQSIALFLRANSHLYENVQQGRWLRFRYFDLMQDVRAASQALNLYQPTLIVAPPSKLEDLARQKEAGDLKIQPQQLISVAEVLEPQDKQRLEQVFGVSVHQIYQATEGLLAISCKHGRLHIQEDLVRMEFESLEDNLVTPILTDLYRRTQPIIRYRLGDVLNLALEGCTCGHPWKVIRQIEGREADLLRFGSQSVSFHAVRGCLYPLAGLKDYVVLQEANQIKIYLEVTKPFEEVAAHVRASLGNLLLARGIHASLECIQGLPAREANIKRRRVRYKQDPVSG